MFKLVKMFFAFCMIAGISILGYEIFKKNQTPDSGLKNNTVEIHDKISEVKKEIQEKLAIAREIMEKASNAPKKDTLRQIKSKNPGKKIKKEPVFRKKYPEVTPKKDVALNPLDEEDRDLTEKVLSKIENQNDAEGPAQIIEKSLNDSGLLTSKVQAEQPEPLDLERVSEISDLYSNANEILNWE